MNPSLRHRERSLLHAGVSPTRWHNLGAWQSGDAYPAAAARLADLVAHAVPLTRGASVLDLGCGAGASLAHWCAHWRAGHVVGVELDPDAAAEARAACAGDPRIDVRTGDAAAAVRVDAGRFDAVVSVDAAYHMPIDAVVDVAWRALTPGGVFAATLLVARAPRTVGVELAARACGLAAGHPVVPDAAVAALHGAGFVDIALTALDEAVLGGFSRHVAGLGLRWRDAPARRLLATAALIDRFGDLGYVCVRGRRPQPTPPRRTA